jgi:hypothetical protein
MDEDDGRVDFDLFALAPRRQSSPSKGDSAENSCVLAAMFFKPRSSVAAMVTAADGDAYSLPLLVE